MIRGHHRFLCVSLLVLAGCGPAPGTVAGTVSVNGKPLPGGLITFLSEVGNRDAFSSAIVNGKYKTDPIPVGPTKVIVLPGLQSPQGGPPTGGNDLQPIFRSAAKRGIDVPLKYQDAKTSGLQFTVKSGENTFDVELK